MSIRFGLSTMLALMLISSTPSLAQVGKRTKLEGKKNAPEVVANAPPSVQIGSLQITNTMSHIWEHSDDESLIKLLPKEKSLYVVANLGGVSPQFEKEIQARLPQAEIMESEDRHLVIFASTDEAASLIRNRDSIDSVESLPWKRKCSAELMQQMRSLMPANTLREEIPIGTSKSDGVNLKEVPEGQPPVLHGVGSDGFQLDEKEPKLDVTFYLFRSQPTEAINNAVSKAGGEVVASGKDLTIVAVRAKIPVSKIEAVAAEKSVREVTLDPQFVKHNDVAVTILARSTASYVPPIAGDGQIVGHADSGIDTGNEASLHSAFRGRIKKAIPLGRPAPTNDWSDHGGHGSHTAGSIVGGESFRGVAPMAQLVHQSLDDANGNLSGIPTPLGNLFEQAYSEGARVHSDSWGVSAIQIGADQKPANLFGGVYLKGAEVDSWLWNNGFPRDMLVVFSAGNDGDFEENDGWMTVTSPGTAKNCLTVGATESVRPKSGELGDNLEDLVRFSSRGPTKDNRVKPDVVAPGTWIASARTHGDQIIWRDDVENVIVSQGALNAWQTTPGFQQIVDPDNCAFSGTHVWRLNRAAGSTSFQDILRSPEVDIPLGHPLTVEVWVRGKAEGLNELYIGSVGGAGFAVFPIQRKVFQRWTVLTAPIPQKYLGTKIRLAVVAQQATPLSEELNLYFDEFKLTTFQSWGSLSSLELASPNDDVDQSFTLSGGTSMAAPLVAGSAVLVRQSLVDSGTVAPTAELIKGILINSADSLSSTGSRPNFQSGWGLVNLRRAIEGDYEFDYQTNLEEQESITYEITVPNGTKELRTTLVWADPPAEQLVNDLDMTLTSPAGDVIHATDSTGNFDHTNNVEGIDRISPSVGLWKVTVKAFKVKEGNSQPFAFVASFLR